MDNETLATELLHEIKAGAKRWFIIAVVELGVILAMLIGFLWYISLPVEETSYYEQEADQEGTTNSDIKQNIGG